MKTSVQDILVGEGASKLEIKKILEPQEQQKFPTVTQVIQESMKMDSYTELIREAELNDIKWKIRTRARFGYGLLGLLFIQNIIVFSLVILAYFRSNLKELEVIFGILIP